MRRFKSIPHAHRLLLALGVVSNLFRGGRHVLSAVNHRLLRTCAFGAWREATRAWIGGMSYRRIGGQSLFRQCQLNSA